MLSSMRNIIILSVLGLVIIGTAAWFIFNHRSNSAYSDMVARTTQVEEVDGQQRVSYGDLSFRYTAGTAGYELLEPSLAEYAEPSLAKAYVLIPQADARATVSVFVFRHPEEVDLAAWAEEESLFTNASSTPEQVSLGEIDALRYQTTQGPAATETYVAHRNGLVYVIAGYFAQPEDQAARTAFGEFVESVELR